MNKRNFKNKTVVVTGAAGNLGLELCLAFGSSGAKIAGLDIRAKALSSLKSLLDARGIESMVKTCDIRDRSACQDAIRQTMDCFKCIDILINNAGITHIQPYREEEKAIDTTRQVMEINFFGAVNCTEAVMDEVVRNKGMIINISSVAGFAPLVDRTAYSASKHALHGFFESLRAELSNTGVKVMMVCPSFVGPSQHVDTAEETIPSMHGKKRTFGKIEYPVTIAHQILEAASREKKLLIVGRTALISYWINRFFPSLYEFAMIRKLKEE